ncbi:alpha/beta hydrolase [Roseateles albus]|uniref:Alpha/beta hydrolase n=1 Tax=Roseateles albus TaxID=2987525 RepID=A0ABT5KGA1_9BURK|nr:alpha/beta hydrolase [Roseateles albus]MDC8772484.1 alpha/beta hydrolase [Roseateles albus]
MFGTSQISIGEHGLTGDLYIGARARGLVVFPHGRDSSRSSRRSQQVAQSFRRQGLGTLLLDLLTDQERAAQAGDGVDGVDEEGLAVESLAQRLLEVPAALPSEARVMPQALFSGGMGAAAAFVAAARQPETWRALVSRGGRPDLACNYLAQVRAASLLIVGAEDTEVLALNRAAFIQLHCEKRIEIVPRVHHLLEESRSLQAVSLLAGNWFLNHLAVVA